MLGFTPCIDMFTAAALKTVAGCLFLIVLFECVRIVPCVQVGSICDAVLCEQTADRMHRENGALELNGATPPNLSSTKRAVLLNFSDFQAVCRVNIVKLWWCNVSFKKATVIRPREPASHCGYRRKGTAVSRPRCERAADWACLGGRLVCASGVLFSVT